MTVATHLNFVKWRGETDTGAIDMTVEVSVHMPGWHGFCSLLASGLNRNARYVAYSCFRVDEPARGCVTTVSGRSANWVSRVLEVSCVASLGWFISMCCEGTQQNSSRSEFCPHKISGEARG